MNTTFEVHDVAVIRGRGPVITRPVDASKRAHADGERWQTGDTARCVELEATVVGIERYPCGGTTGELDLALMLRGVEVEQLAVGQVWKRVGG